MRLNFLAFAALTVGCAQQPPPPAPAPHYTQQQFENMLRVLQVTHAYVPLYSINCRSSEFNGVVSTSCQ